MSKLCKKQNKKGNSLLCKRMTLRKLFIPHSFIFMLLHALWIATKTHIQSPYTNPSMCCTNYDVVSLYTEDKHVDSYALLVQLEYISKFLFSKLIALNSLNFFVLKDNMHRFGHTFSVYYVLLI